MSRAARFVSFLDQLDEDLGLSAEQLKTQLNHWVDEHFGAVRVEVRQMRGRISARYLRHTNQVTDTEGRQVVEVAEEEPEEQPEELVSVPSTSKGRKRRGTATLPPPSTLLNKKPRILTKKYSCKFPGCEESFLDKVSLINHEHIHLGIKPYSCTWQDCHYSAQEQGAVVKHVRIMHFKLPPTVKLQNRLNIEDNRNAKNFVRVDQNLVNRRLGELSPEELASLPSSSTSKGLKRSEQSFGQESQLISHGHAHLDIIKPYSCAWPPDCHFSATKRSDVVTHIRTAHFKLPRCVKHQAQLNIEDSRNANDFVRVDQHLANRRLIIVRMSIPSISGK